MKIQKEEFGILKAADFGFGGSLLGLFFAFFGVFMIFKGDTFVDKPPLWLAILFIAFGISSFFLNTRRTIEINKTTGRIIISENSILIRKKNEVSVNSVKALLYNNEFIQGEYGLIKSHWLALVTQDRVIDISSRRSVYGMSNFFYSKDLLPDKEVGEHIAKFIGVPFTEAKEPNAYEVIQAIKESISNHMKNATEQQSANQQSTQKNN